MASLQGLSFRHPVLLTLEVFSVECGVLMLRDGPGLLDSRVILILSYLKYPSPRPMEYKALGLVLGRWELSAS